jgi:hypothetical protein
MSTLDFDKLRKKKQTVSSEFDFEAYRNRQIQEEPPALVVPSSSDLLKDTLKSAGAGRITAKPEAKQETVPNSVVRVQPTAKTTLDKALPATSLLTPKMDAPIQSTLQGKLPAADLVQQTGRGPENASDIPGISQYEINKKEIDKAPPVIKQYAQAMNYLTEGNPLGIAIGNAFSGNSGATRKDSSGNKFVDKAADVVNNLVTPFITPTGAPVGAGPNIGSYEVAEKALSKGLGQSAINRGAQLISKVAPKVSPQTAQNIARQTLTETIAGPLQNVSMGLINGQDSNREIAINAATGVGLGAGLGFAGSVIGSSIGRLLRRNNIPEETVTEILALPEGRGTIRQSAAAERSTLAAGTDPIVTPFTPEPLGPTVARRGTLTNPYRQKFEALIQEAQARQDSFTPGREDLELENLWSQMAEPNDPSLDELINLAYQPRRITPQVGDISRARELQRQREVYGIGNPVRSSAEMTAQTIQPTQSDMLTNRTMNAEPMPAPKQTQTSMPREIEISNKQARNEPLSQEDIDYILSGQFDQTKLPPEQSSISSQTSRYDELMAATTEPTAMKEPVAAQKQDLFTDLFGEQNLGISANRSDIKNQGPVTTEDMIVGKSIRNDKDGVGEAVKAQVRAIYQDHVDALDPLKKLGDDVYDAAMDANRANNIANVIVNDKFVNLQGEVIGESLKDITTKVARGQDKKFLDFLNLRRATTRMARGEKVFDDRLNMTPDKVRERIDMLEQRYPGFSDIANDYYDFWNNFRQLSVDEGMMSPRLKKVLEDAEPYYVPQNRQFERWEKPGRDALSKVKKNALSGQKLPIQKLSDFGSGRPLVDMRKSTVEATGAWINAMMRNRSLQPVVKNLRENPDFYGGIVKLVDDNKNLVDLNEVAKQDGIEGLIEAFNNNFDSVMNKGKSVKLNDENILRVMVDGEPAYIQVGDPEIVKAAMSMGPQATSLLTDVMGAMSNATKRGATGLLAPVFAIKGATMDLASSAIQAQNPVKQAAYTVYSIFSGIGDALEIPGLRNWAQEYRRQGGGYSYALKGERNVNKSIDNLTRYNILSGKNALKVGKKIAASPFNILEGVGNVFENAPRIAASRIELERLGGEITPENIRKAMNAGREATVNYSRKGLKSYEIESIAPYSNAAVQGTRRVLKAFKDNPVRTTAAVGVIAVLPKLIEYSRFHDDEDYQNIPARERMRHTFVSKNADGSFVKIPFDPAYTSFGEMTIEGLRAFKDGDPNAFKGSMDALVNAWTPPLLTGLLQGITKGDGLEGSIAGLANATVFGPPTAIISNKSFTGAPIVPKSMEDRSGRYQYDEKTSALAKKIGELTNFSPVMTDYIIKSYGGDAARIGLPLTSTLGQGNTRNTLLRNFITDPTFTNTLSEDFYAAKDKLNEAYANFNEAGAELPKWYNDELRKLLNSSAKGSVSKDLSDLRAYKKQITADKSMSDKERTEKLREVQEKINTIYIQVNTALRENGVIK